MHRRQRSRRWGVVLAAVAFVAVVGGFLFVTLRDDDEAATDDSLDLGPTTTLDPTTLSPEGQELYALVQAGETGTYHAAFAVDSAELASQGVGAGLELWRSGEQFREHRVSTDASGVNMLVIIGGPEGTTSCTQAPTETAFTCAEASSDQTAFSDAYASIIALLPEADTTARDETIAGQPGRCYSVTSEQATAELCFTLEGVPLLVDDGTIRFEATVVDANVTPEILALPAPGGQPPPATTVPPPTPPPPTAATTTTAPAS
jgi:hypothetical protein